MAKILFLTFFSWIGVITFTIFIVLETSGLADSGTAEAIASFLLWWIFRCTDYSSNIYEPVFI